MPSLIILLLKTLIFNIIYNILWVLQHPDLTVTSEEKVLNAILMWGMKAKDLYGWEVVDELMINSFPEQLFGERLQSVHDLLPFVRFPLLPYALLKKVCRPLVQKIVSQSTEYMNSLVWLYLICNDFAVGEEQH